MDKIIFAMISIDEFLLDLRKTWFFWGIFNDFPGFPRTLKFCFLKFFPRLFMFTFLSGTTRQLLTKSKQNVCKIAKIRSSIGFSNLATLLLFCLRFFQISKSKKIWKWSSFFVKTRWSVILSVMADHSAVLNQKKFTVIHNSRHNNYCELTTHTMEIQQKLR